jgi:hypothetical protein
MSRVARHAALLIALAATLLVACGGGDESEDRSVNEVPPDRFVNEFPPFNERIAEVSADVAKRIRRAGRRPPQRLAGNLGDAADTMGELRREVEELEAPATLAPQQQVVVTAIRDVRRALERMSDVASVNLPPPALGNARIRVAEASRALERARSTFADGMRAAEN